MLEHAGLKRTGLPQMIRALPKMKPEVYLEVLKRKPYLEQVVKSGLSALANELLSSNQNLDIEMSHDFAKMLKIDKNRMKRLREHDGGCIYLSWLRYEKRRGIHLNDAEIEFFEQQNILPEKLEFITVRLSVTRIYNYVIKQYEMSKRSPKELVSTWQDYFSMASRLHMDLEDELIYKPKDLIKSHDDVVKICGGKDQVLRAAELLKNYPDIDLICQDIKSKYEYKDKEFILVGPTRIEDILMEGNALGHCLDSSDIYFDRMQKRESYILFLRRTKKPENPYYTLEIEPGGTVR